MGRLSFPGPNATQPLMDLHPRRMVHPPTARWPHITIAIRAMLALWLVCLVIAFSDSVITTVPQAVHGSAQLQRLRVRISTDRESADSHDSVRSLKAIFSSGPEVDPADQFAPPPSSSGESGTREREAGLVATAPSSPTSSLASFDHAAPAVEQSAGSAASDAKDAATQESLAGGSPGSASAPRPADSARSAGQGAPPTSAEGIVAQQAELASALQRLRLDAAVAAAEPAAAAGANGRASSPVVAPEPAAAASTEPAFHGGFANPFYASPRYQCKRMGRLAYTEPTNSGLERDPQRRGRGDYTGDLHYAPWEMGWPRFLREEHEQWFGYYEIARWRLSR